MSSAKRQLVKQGDEFTIIGGDITSLSGKQPMLVNQKAEKIRPIYYRKKIIRCKLGSKTIRSKN
jgi:hypothetical protein